METIMSAIARAFRRLTDSLSGAGDARDAARQQQRQQDVALARQRSEQQNADQDTARSQRRRRGNRLFLSDESGGFGSSATLGGS
jgi:hypothetical protein